VVLPVRDAGRSILPANYFLRPAFYVVMVSIQAVWVRWTHIVARRSHRRRNTGGREPYNRHMLQEMQSNLGPVGPFDGNSLCG
jgi:hypothetical protein